MSHRSVFIVSDSGLADLLDAIQDQLRQRGIEVVRGLMPAPGAVLTYPPESFDQLFSKAEVMMFSARSLCTREVMLAAPLLRGIVNPAIGLETVDLKAADELGLIVGHGATAENYLGMAESTVMLMLALMYQLRASEKVLAGELPRPTRDRSWSRMLRGRTIGLIGWGRIAKATAALLASFQADIVVHQRGRTSGATEDGVRFVDLDELLQTSDVVSMHATVTDASRSLLGERELAMLMPSAYLVNTARGQTIDEAALFRALRDRRIAGAALDTFVVEPLPQSSPLRTLDNVILTPHMVGQTIDSFESLLAAGVANITRILDGELPLYCKNPQTETRWRERLTEIDRTREG